MLVAKLNPNRFTAMSGKMAAIVGYILNRKFTDPSFVEMVVTSDNFVLARVEGDIGMNEFIGHYSDLENNWKRLLEAADDLTNEERTEATNLFNSKFGRKSSLGEKRIYGSPFTAEW